MAIYPEDQLEARLVYEEPIRDLVQHETNETQNARMRYLYETIDVQRARRNVTDLQEMYNGQCQICLYHPKKIYGHRICHGHHIQWLSRGGDDSLDNMVLVCPSHHSAIHRDDAVFDYSGHAFQFSNGLKERLEMNRHLPAA